MAPSAAPPHPRLPPRRADDGVVAALSPRAGRGNARRPSGQAGIGHVPIWKRLVPLSPWAGRGRRPPLAGRRREPVGARVRGRSPGTWLHRTRPLTLGCRLAAPTTGSSRPSPRVWGEGNARRPLGQAGIGHVSISKRQFPSPRRAGRGRRPPLVGRRREPVRARVRGSLRTYGFSGRAPSPSAAASPRRRRGRRGPLPACGERRMRTDPYCGAGVGAGSAGMGSAALAVSVDLASSG